MLKRLIKLVVLFLIIMLVYGIYYTFKSDKINYVALGDDITSRSNSYVKHVINNIKVKYFNNYAKEKYQIKDVIKEININNYLKRDLRESNLVTISIGINDYINSSNINNILLDLDNCIKEIRKYSKQKLIILGLYNIKDNNIDIVYIDDKSKEIANKYDATYISLYQVFNNNYIDINTKYYPNDIGQMEIAKLILKNT